MSLFVDGDANSIVHVLKVLKWFKASSGLDINKEETKVVKIGASRDGSIPWQGKFGYKWSDTFEIWGIHYKMNTFNEVTEINILRNTSWRFDIAQPKTI